MCENSPKKETLKFGSRESFFLFFFPHFFGSRWTGNHPKEDLAKFGYSSERQVGRKKREKNPCYILARGTRFWRFHFLFFQNLLCVDTMEIFYMDM
jgi:hypothetical protein